jgi:TonB family protein
MTSANKRGGSGGAIGIVAVLVVLVLLGVGAALMLNRSMGRGEGEETGPVEDARTVAPPTQLVEAPPPLPETPPEIEQVPEEEPVVEETEPGKPKKKIPSNGTIDPAAAAAVTKKNFTKVRACYEKQLKINNLLQGNITVKIVVYPDGSVNSVRVVKDTMRNETMNVCIQNEIKHWTFPKPEGGKAEIHVPYRFEPKAG